MDHPKELATRIGGKIRTQNLYNWNYDRTSLRELVLNYKGYNLAVSDFGDQFELAIKVESDFSFAVNLPDKIFCYNTPSSIDNFPYKVYYQITKVPGWPMKALLLKDFFMHFSIKLKD